MIREAIAHITTGATLSEEEAEAVMEEIMTGVATQAQMGAFLTALRLRPGGETVQEITGLARIMREKAVQVHLTEATAAHALDTCGTGGDGARLFNVSTAVAFVVAAAGGRVAKHGNRAMSGSSGSADVLEALGVKLDLPPARIIRCIDEVGVGFLYAPAHHSATKYAAAPRKELGTRTLFNLLGPLTNPAGAPHQLLGVFAQRWVEPLAKVLHALGSHHVLVVHSQDGLDEISIAAPTWVAELQHGQIRSYMLNPADLGFQTHSLDSLRVASVAESLKLLREVLMGATGPAADMVMLNAGAAIYAAGVSPTLAAGVERARAVIKSGEAQRRLERLVAATR